MRSSLRSRGALCTHHHDHHRDHRHPSAVWLTHAQALFRLISNFWNAYGTEDKVGLRDFVLDLLAQKGPSMEEFVVTALAHLLVCRLAMRWVLCCAVL